MVMFCWVVVLVERAMSRRRGSYGEFVSRFGGGGGLLVGMKSSSAPESSAASASALARTTAERFACLERRLLTLHLLAARVEDGLVFPLVARFLLFASGLVAAPMHPKKDDLRPTLRGNGPDRCSRS
jgi:hypothetical protein